MLNGVLWLQIFITSTERGLQILKHQWKYIDLERYSRAYPQENKEIEETYRLLNKKCLEAMAECD